MLSLLGWKPYTVTNDKVPYIYIYILVRRWGRKAARCRWKVSSNIGPKRTRTTTVQKRNHQTLLIAIWYAGPEWPQHGPGWCQDGPRWAKMGQEKTWTKKGSGRTLKIRAWYWGKANKKRGESRKTLKILAWYWENANKKKGKWRLRWPKTTPRWQRRAQRPKMATEP